MQSGSSRRHCHIVVENAKPSCHNVAGAQVNLKGVVSAVVVTTLVLEGWSTKLDPEIRIMDALKDTLPVSWSERSKRIADKIWRNMSLDPVLHD